MSNADTDKYMSRCVYERYLGYALNVAIFLSILSLVYFCIGCFLTKEIKVGGPAFFLCLLVW